jgi:hypothetical protein
MTDFINLFHSFRDPDNVSKHESPLKFEMNCEALRNCVIRDNNLLNELAVGEQSVIQLYRKIIASS